MNPYEPSQYDPELPDVAGRIDLMAAVQDGFDATRRNFIRWLIAGIVFFVLTVALQCSDSCPGPGSTPPADDRPVSIP